MRNLRLSYPFCIADDSLKDADAFCINQDFEVIYFANRQSLMSLEKGSKQIQLKELNLDISDEICKIKAMEYLPNGNFLCLAFSNGDIAIYSFDDEKVEFVGNVASGICHATWSPDQELFLVLTGAGTFILMTKDFDPLVEKSLHPEEFGESSPMTVGWGSKETQFHGSVGKAAAKVNVQDPEKAVQWDDRLPRSSWRGDGELFATSVVDHKQGCRKIRVWSREGILQSTSEAKAGLQQALCWRPSGNLISSTRQLPNKHEVIFFEKNGLQHGEFTLPYPPNSFVVKEALWNMDSSILAIFGHQLKDPSHISVTLWTINNYHWYLKQSLDFGYKPDFGIEQITWDSHHPNRLHVLCTDGSYMQYNWTWQLFHSRALGKDNATVAVIDNDKLLVTPFNRVVVPPPMCAYSLPSHSSVNDVVFAPESEDFAIIHASGEISFFSTTDSTEHMRSVCSPKLDASGGEGFRCMTNLHYHLGTYSITWAEDVSIANYPLSLFNWTWIEKDRLLCVHSDPESEKSFLLTIVLNKDEGDGRITLNGSICKTLDEIVVYVGTCDNGSTAALKMKSGNIMTYKQGELLTWQCSSNKDLMLPSPCLQFSLLKMNDTVVVLTLSERLSLFCEDILLVSNCTSYCVHGDFLLITTSDDNVKCYSKKDILKIRELNNGMTLKELASQPCERRCCIVTSVVSKAQLILQTPRGNLEVVHPRPLVLRVIGSLIDSIQYKKAFDIAKEHRINLNIFYDHDPIKFQNSVATFVEQINLPSDLNLFLVSLTNDNVTHSLYPFHSQSNSDKLNGEHKRDIVCDAIQSVILKSKDDMERYFDTIMATYAQRTASDFKSALLLIKKTRDSEDNAVKAEALVDKALNFLLLLVDVNELYKVALGTYDFEIAVMVAEKSNMDPKEYLQFLNDLQEMEDNYRKFKIDMHLERYKEAVQHISKCDDHFDECLSLIKDKRLYTSSLELFPPKSEKYKIIWVEYGDYLWKKLYYKDAGIVYLKGESYDKSSKAFLESGDWQLAISASRDAGYSETQLHKFYSDLAVKLKQQLRHQDSAYVLEYYMKDVMQAIFTLIKGQCWDSALNLIMKSNDQQMIGNNLKPAILEQSEYLVNWFTEKDASFDQYLARLKAIREKGENNFASGNDNVEEDLISEVSSVSNSGKQLSGSLVTRKSSRSRRKLELKKFRLKEGSPNEDLALMAELSEIISSVDKIKDNFYSFVRMLVILDEQQQALLVQDKLKRFIAKIETEMPCIWSTLKLSDDMLFGPQFTTKDTIEIIKKQNKAIQNFADPKVAPPTWRKNIDLFVLIDASLQSRS